MLIYVIVWSVFILSLLLLIFLERQAISERVTEYIVGPVVCCAALAIIWVSYLGIAYNLNTAERHLLYSTERETINDTLRDFETTPNSIFSSETSLLLYTETINKAKKLNEQIYTVELNQNNIWTGWYQDKAYLNIAPIKYLEINL